MSHSTIRAAIAAILATLPGIGKVFVRERYAKTEKELRDLFLVGGKINGWHVRRVGIWQTSPVLGRWVVTTQWEIRGVLSFSDADESELDFDSLIDAAQDAFRADLTLGGVVATTVLGEKDDDPAGLQLDDSGPVMFAGVLCHGAKFSLFTRHYC